MTIGLLHPGAEKGWRWVAEMDEIVAAAGLPAGFHEAAAKVFEDR